MNQLPIYKPSQMTNPTSTSILTQNNIILKKLPQLLFRQLEHYQHAHTDDTIQMNANFTQAQFNQDLDKFKIESFQFVKLLVQLKKNFNMLLSKRQQKTERGDKVGNFMVLVAQQLKEVLNARMEGVASEGKVKIQEG